jgi:NADPH2:quinone reductase
MDAAGIVESVGEDVERLRVGEEVMAAVSPRRPEGGAQAELLEVPAASVVPIPDGATLEQASTLPMNGPPRCSVLSCSGLRAGSRSVEGKAYRDADGTTAAGSWPSHAP